SNSRRAAPTSRTSRPSFRSKFRSPGGAAPARRHGGGRPLAGLKTSGSRRGPVDAFPAGFDLAHQRRHLVERIGAVVEVRTQQRPRDVLVKPLEVCGDLAALLLVETHVEPLDQTQRLVDLLALRPRFA